jgi:two-component system, sensor histidine kinase and response regulator
MAIEEIYMMKAKLLVVEDEPHLLLGIREILQLDEYDVVTALNGKIGLEVLEKTGDRLPDLIVSDIMMPFMSGIEFLEEVRKRDEWISIPFIFLTAKGEKEDVQRGKKLGVDDYLIKPFDADELLVAVDSRLRRHKAINEKQVKTIDGVKRNIITILNHEFRTPLTLVVAYADMIKSSDVRTMTEEELVIYLDEIGNGAERLRRLIENFMLLVELETGDAAQTYEWRRSKIDDIGNLMKEAFDQIVVDNLAAVCSLDIPRHLPSVIGDREYLVKVFRELLHNAVKFSGVDKFAEPDGPIVFSARSVGNELHVSIRDSGRGIEDNQLEEIWQLFYQIKREKFEDPGTGSGLAIVKGLVDIHGGQMQIESKHGEGSCFTLVLSQVI